MIVTVDKLKQHITTDVPVPVLEEKLLALETMVRKYTNNNFQHRNIRERCPVVSQKLYLANHMFKVGDTVQISESQFNDGVYTVAVVEGNLVTVSEDLIDEPNALVTLVKYPADVQMGVINLMKWELTNRDKVGISSETISRHSVTYFNMDGDNSTMGFPKSLMGFLRPYKKARF